MFPLQLPGLGWRQVGGRGLGQQMAQALGMLLIQAPLRHFISSFNLRRQEPLMEKPHVNRQVLIQPVGVEPGIWHF